MAGYTKLFSDIVDSSIWQENHATCKVWITLLALSDPDGYVRGSTGWLRTKALVTEQECLDALKTLEASDTSSRTKDYDGRRIETLEDGWLILNYLKFRERLSPSETASKSRERVRKHRERYKALRNASSVTLPLPASASASSSVPVPIDHGSFGKCENLFFGDVPDDLIELAGTLDTAPNAEEWHNLVEEKIRCLGYTTEREVSCPFTVKGEFHTGRLDLVASKLGLRVAVELDYRTPRAKSIAKVKKFGIGMVILRDPKTIYHSTKTNRQIPTLDMVKLHCAKIELSDQDAESFFDYYESNGWRVGKNPMKSWTSALANWKRNKSNFQSNQPGSPKPKSALDLKTIIQAKQLKAQELKTQFCSEGPLGNSWSDESARLAFKDLRTQIKALTTQLSTLA